MSIGSIFSQSRSWTFPLLAVVYFFACEGRPHPVAPPLPELSPTPTTAQAKSGEELLQQYQQIAASTEAQAHKKLVEALRSSEFLFRLDSRDDYRRKAVADLRLARLFQTMKQNDSPAMRETLLSLARANKPEECDACDELLIKTLTIVRPAPPEAIKFYAIHSEPDSIQLGFVMDALCENGSAPAIALLEKRLLATKYPPEQKLSWMRRTILQYRNNAPLLQSADRWLSTSLPKSLRPALVEVLFDYRPDEWYRAHNPPQPDTRPLTPEAVKLLQKVGATALQKVTLSAAQRSAVTKRLNELK